MLVLKDEVWTRTGQSTVTVHTSVDALTTRTTAIDIFIPAPPEEGDTFERVDDEVYIRDEDT